MKALTILLQAQGDGGLGMILMMVAIFAIMYFFMIRPQRGQEVITAGGIYGVVRDIDEVKNVLIVEVASGVRIRVDRNSVFASAENTGNYTK